MLTSFVNAPCREMLEFVAEREASDPLLQKNDPDGCPFMCLPIGRNK